MYLEVIQIMENDLTTTPKEMIEIKNLSIIFESFFKDNTPNIYIDKTQTNEKKLRLKDIKSNLYLNINWKDIIREIFYDNNNNFIEYLNDKLNIADLLLDIAYNKIYTFSNRYLKLWLFYQEPENRAISGLYDQKQNYAEFEIEENYDFINNHYDSIDFGDLMTNFYMGDIEVRISSPSDAYRLLFFHHISEKIIRLRPSYINWNETLWQDRLTLCFKNIKGNCKDLSINNILQEGLFLLMLYNRDIFRLGITTYFNQKSINNIENHEIKYFPKSNFADAFCFYNEAYRYTNEMKFLNFYKVIEYFFDINKRQLAVTAIEKYNNSSKNLEIRNEELHRELNSTYTNDEKAQLKNLLSNVFIIDCVTELIENNFDEQISIENFGERLYRVRNVIVHSKEASRKVPEILTVEDTFAKNNYGLKLSDWINIINELCLIIIQHFCYGNQFNVIEKFHEMKYKY